MDTGIPELGMPPLDPIHIDLIDFKFFNMTIEFVHIDMTGFKTFKLEKSSVDKAGRWQEYGHNLFQQLLIRKWDIELSIPRVEAEGTYRMSGTIPPNFDLGFSTGDERWGEIQLFIWFRIGLKVFCGQTLHYSLCQTQRERRQDWRPRLRPQHQNCGY